MAMPTRGQLFEILNYTLTFESLQQVQRKLRFPRAPNHITREKLQIKRRVYWRKLSKLTRQDQEKLFFLTEFAGPGFAPRESFSRFEKIILPPANIWLSLLSLLVVETLYDLIAGKTFLR
jgi:hypothetical protein